ncbi:MAG TPA: NAD(P)-dependent oxidoreductase [Vicinamibacterales bacterium]|nr:NAD(P)-dependent oxidoreductase [Vicinamibacterales bacterium]
MTSVAFLGTGLLGSGMVEAMLGRGDRVTVWNRTASKARALERLGAIVAATPEEAVAAGDYVHMALPDDGVVDDMMARCVPHLRKGAAVLDHSTTAPAGAKARVPRLQSQGIRFLHCPVFMSPQMARDSKGIMLVSGPEAVFADVAGELRKMTGEVWYLGERPELAASYKIFGNSMLFVVAAGIADVFAMAKEIGIAPAEAIGVFSKFNAGGVIPSRGEKMARADFSATFELTMARKDLRLMIEAAGHQPLTVLPCIASRMDDAIAKGHGQDDLGAIAAGLV